MVKFKNRKNDIHGGGNVEIEYIIFFRNES